METLKRAGLKRSTVADIDCDSDERLARRIKRELKDLSELEDAVSEYLDITRFSHAKYVEPTKWCADLIFNGTNTDHKGLLMMTEWIKYRLKNR